MVQVDWPARRREMLKDAQLNKKRVLARFLMNSLLTIETTKECKEDHFKHSFSLVLPKPNRRRKLIQLWNHRKYQGLANKMHIWDRCSSKASEISLWLSRDLELFIKESDLHTMPYLLSSSPPWPSAISCMSASVYISNIKPLPIAFTNIKWTLSMRSCWTQRTKTTLTQLTFPSLRPFWIWLKVYNLESCRRWERIVLHLQAEAAWSDLINLNEFDKLILKVRK